jgi:hypothetical protein
MTECIHIRQAVLAWTAIDGWGLEYVDSASGEAGSVWLTTVPDDATDEQLIEALEDSEEIEDLIGWVRVYYRGKPTLRIHLFAGEVIKHT